MLNMNGLNCENYSLYAKVAEVLDTLLFMHSNPSRKDQFVTVVEFRQVCDKRFLGAAKIWMKDCIKYCICCVEGFVDFVLSCKLGVKVPCGELRGKFLSFPTCLSNQNPSISDYKDFLSPIHDIEKQQLRNHHMSSPMRILKNPIPWIAVLVPIWLCAGFSGHWSFSLLITVVMILSTVFFTFSKHKQVLVSKPVQDETLSSEKAFTRHAEEEVSKQEPDQSETIMETKEAQENEDVHVHNNYLVRSPELYSESETIGHSSEDSDVDWPYSGNLGPSPDCSNGSISDEESLIEIALPSGHYVSPKEEEPKFNLLQKLPDFSSDTIFQQDGLVELLAEINEEENLIEIDISMGSIKCSRLEIEA
ncbi:unnamed protein product [Ilex paraguariensis]|uniref:Uncharacterized protein n=1 Tax=Ilex paraguariensis TaxID=185542 RepID=A0ABC8S3S0_9AQUA